MTLLALEFSSERRSAALARDGVILAEAAETGGRATNAFALIDRALAESKIPRDEIEAMAVGLGPGSYTGIRAAIAVAQGWQLARGIKLLGIPSVEALAAQAQAEKIFGRVNVVVDAQRGEFYLATWEISDAGRRGPRDRVFWPARQKSPFFSAPKKPKKSPPDKRIRRQRTGYS